MKKNPTKQEKAKALDDIKKTKGSDSIIAQKALATELGDQYDDSFNAFNTIRPTWSDKEAMLVNRSRDGMSQTTKSQVNDPRLSTIAFERAARVMAQLPTGKVQALTQKDTGKNLMMNMIVNKYIYPNANAQFELLTKFRMWDIYSDVYGSMPMLVDYRIDDSYIGPDCYLTPMRNFLPQPGKISTQELDYCFIDNWVSVAWLKSRSKKFWTNIDEVISAVKDGGESPSNQDQNKRSFVEQQLYPYISGGQGDTAMVKLSTRYEHDRWVTFFPGLDNLVLRDIGNPQKNNRIPIVLKHCFPLLDSIIGLGEFERGKTLQFAINSLINLYLDGVKMSIFPPMMIDAGKVVPSSIRVNPAAKWLVTGPNAVQPFNVSPQGINTFQSTYSFLISALLNMSGTTDTSTTAKTDPGMGKTPEAIQMLAQRESARDNWDRYMMEKAVEEVFDIMVDMVATKQEKPIEFDLFETEIKQIQKENADLGEMFKVYDSKKYGHAKITQKEIGNTKYKFFIDAGTSMKQDDEQTNQVAQGLLALVLKNPQIIQALQQSPQPRAIDIAELFEVVVNTSGLPNANKIIIDLPQAPANPADQKPQVLPNESMNFKDMPAAGQIQMAQQAGIRLSPQDVGAGQPQPDQAMPMPGQQPVAPAGMPGAAPDGATPPMGGNGFNFKNPEIAALAQKIMGGQANG